MHPLHGPPAVIRIDPVPGFTALRNYETLKSLRLSLEIGRVKNPNKNPVVEKAILELEEELLKQEPTGGPVSQLVLSYLLQALILAFTIQVCRLGNYGLNEVSSLMNNFPFQTGKTFSVNIRYAN